MHGYPAAPATLPPLPRLQFLLGQTVALEGLQEALRQRRASPAGIARHAERGGVATVF